MKTNVKLLIAAVAVIGAIILYTLAGGYKCPHDVTVKASCTQNGSCRICGKVIPATGHWSKLTDSAEASCEQAGYRKYRCLTCRAEWTDTVPAHGHTSEEWKQTRAPSVTQTGIKRGKCTTCGQVVEKSIPVLGTTSDAPIVISAGNLYTRAMKNPDLYKYKYVEVQAKVLSIRKSNAYRNCLIYGTWAGNRIYCDIFFSKQQISKGDTVTFSGYVRISGREIEIDNCSIKK